MPFLVLSHSNDENKGFVGEGGEGGRKGVYYQIEVSFIEVPALSTPGPSLIFTLTPPK